MLCPNVKTGVLMLIFQRLRDMQIDTVLGLSDVKVSIVYPATDYTMFMKAYEEKFELFIPITCLVVFRAVRGMFGKRNQFAGIQPGTYNYFQQSSFV